eukprot:2871208-Rhodomonas_salina.2
MCLAVETCHVTVDVADEQPRALLDVADRARDGRVPADAEAGGGEGGDDGLSQAEAPAVELQDHRVRSCAHVQEPLVRGQIGHRPPRHCLGRRNCLRRRLCAANPCVRNRHCTADAENNRP